MEPKLATFENMTLYVGIDIHKRQWHVSIFTASIHHRTFSQPPEPLALKHYIDKYFPGAKVICAYEVTKFGFWIYRALIDFGYQCLVVNPADIPSTSVESSNKSDSMDSRKIARTLQAGLLQGVHVASLQTSGDRHLFRYRKRLWSDLVRTKNRIKDKFLFYGITIPPQWDNPYWSKAFLRWVAEVEMPSASARLTLDLLLEQYHLIYRHFLKTSVQVRKLLRTARYKEQGKLLRTIPGIGPLTAVQLLVELEDINRFTSFKKLNSYVGFRPTTHSSGDSDRRGRMTYRRHNALRSALVECAWQSVQKDPAMMLRYEEVVKRGSKKRAIVVMARKLLSRIYHVLKTQEPYQLGKAA
jgi:transposase